MSYPSREQNAAYMREWHRRHPGYHRKQNLKKNYKLSLEQYSEILHRQGGGCAICGTGNPPVLNVDHDHKTGKVRGLLCLACNMALGGLRDDPSLLRRAIAYLEAK